MVQGMSREALDGQAATAKVNSVFWPRNKEEFRQIVRKAFMDGILHATHWISIEGDYPVKNTPILARDLSDKSYQVLFWNGECWQSQTDDNFIIEVTHWRYIE